MEVKHKEQLGNIMWSYIKSSFKQTLRDYFSPVANAKYVLFGEDDKGAAAEKSKNKNTPHAP